MTIPQSVRTSPFRGLAPFGRNDEAYFFGRDVETGIVTANVFAHPCTVLFGPSGVGKSSLLEAGVRAKLEAMDGVLVVSNRAWAGEPVELVRTALRAAAGFPLSGHVSLAEEVRAAADATGGSLVLLLDQFEEYLRYHPPGSRFDSELAAAINDPTLPLSVLLGLREDALAALDRFDGEVPFLLDHLLRVEHLTRAGGLRAIEGPLQRFAEETGVTVRLEDGLADEVLSGVRTGHHIFRTGDGPQCAETGDAARVEAPFLQLVMLLLWQAERRSGSSELRRATLRRLGGVQAAVRGRFDELMQALPLPDRAAAERLLDFLVTPSRTKIAWQASDLAHFARVPVERTNALLNTLAGSDYRVLRRLEQPGQSGAPVTLFELYHDVLADGILEWKGARRRRGKRIVICCDGVWWSRRDHESVNNVEKIARCVDGDPDHTDAVQQLVLYLSGASTSTWWSRIAMRWGWGLYADVNTAYRFLATNYEPGDEIYLFGFSRGAFTARALVGMIGRVGLLTRRALNGGKLVEAIGRYRNSEVFEQSVAQFARDYSHSDVTISFLGVFDTVGVLGRPGSGRRHAQFHDVRLPRLVDCARHALAIDEPRSDFEPCLWQSDQLGGSASQASVVRGQSQRRRRGLSRVGTCRYGAIVDGTRGVPRGLSV